MRVQGHGLDTQLLPELAHADRVDPVAVGQVDGGLQDPRPGKGGAALRSNDAGVNVSYLGRPLDILTVYGLRFLGRALTA